MIPQLTRYPKAEWIPSPNHYTDVALRPRLIVLHATQGEDISGTDAWFSEPASQVSAHFCIGRDGSVHQYIALDLVAWAECNFNPVAFSIEHSAISGQTLTDPQLAASLELQRWLSSNWGIPLHRTADPLSTGVIGHGELGIPGCDHPDCPGAPILHQVGASLATPDRPTPAKEKTRPPHHKEHHVSIVPSNPKQTQQLSSLGRQAAAIAAIVTSLTGTLPANLRSWGFIGGAILLVVEHFVGDPSTGTPPPPAA